MLNTNTGVSELLVGGGNQAPTTGKGRSGTGDGEAFSGTLKGQMKKVAEADGNQGEQGRATTDKAAAGKPETQGQGASAADEQVSAEQGRQAENEAEAGTVAEEEPELSAEAEQAGLLQELEAEAEEVQADAEGGKELPEWLPQTLPVDEQGSEAADEAVSVSILAAVEGRNGTQVATQHSAQAGQSPLLADSLKAINGEGRAPANPQPDMLSELGEEEATLAEREASRSLLERKGSEELWRGFKLAEAKQGAAMAAAPLLNKEDAVAELRQLTGSTPLFNGNAVMPGAPSAAGGAGAAGATPSLNVPVPMGQPGWDQAMAERVMWMARGQVQQAQIQLNPRSMGPIEVSISVSNDQANVHFVAHNPGTREALEAAIPRLREMMQESGLNLAQSDVSQHSAGQQGQAEGSSGQAAGMMGEEFGEEGEALAAESTIRTIETPVGLVDFFA